MDVVAVVKKKIGHTEGFFVMNISMNFLPPWDPQDAR